MFCSRTKSSLPSRGDVEMEQRRNRRSRSYDSGPYYQNNTKNRNKGTPDDVTVTYENEAYDIIGDPQYTELPYVL